MKMKICLILGLIILIFLITFISPKGLLNNNTDYVFYKDFLTLKNIYPHNNESFVEGLFFYRGNMYETSGLYSKSFLTKNINIKTGKGEIYYPFTNDIFAEGASILNDILYVLTYKEKKVYLLNPNNLEVIDILDYYNDGWGLTTDGKVLIASDGSSSIYIMDKDLNILKTLNVTYHEKSVNNINELEYIDGYIWANIWQTNDIVVIDMNNGNVVKKINFSGLYPNIKNNDDVLNGIAYQPETKKIYITGKRWDSIFEFEKKL